MRFDPALVPEPVRRLRGVLKDYPVFVVGGIVRDSVRKALARGENVVREVEGHDWDLATAALPEKVLSLLAEHGIASVPVGLAHGTVAALIDGNLYEITTFRVDLSCDGRHAEVQFTPRLEDDLERRDFTFNALAMDVDSGEIADLFGGIEDLKAGLVRAIGDPEARFREDLLRLMRAVRFAALLEGRIEENTRQAMSRLAGRITGISPERIRDELLMLLETTKPSLGFDLMRQCGLLRAVLPELDACFGVGQNRWHSHDVGEHTLLCVDAVHSKHPFVRWVALLHDIAKPQAKRFSEERDDYVFYDHQQIGAEAAAGMMRRLRFPNRDIDRAQVIIGEHMFNITPDLSEKAVRRLMRRLGEENIRPFLRLRIADRRGNRVHPQGWEPGLFNLVRKIRRIRRAEACLDRSGLAINGGDLKDLGLRPGPVFSEILDFLLEQVLDDPVNNTRPTLLALIAEWAQANPQEYRSALEPAD